MKNRKTLLRADGKTTMIKIMLVEHLDGISRIDTTRLLRAAQQARLNIIYHDSKVCQKDAFKSLSR